MILRGVTNKDSNRAKKAYGKKLENYGVGIERRKGIGPRINFIPKDLVGVSTLHADALVIRTTITNYEVARVLIDMGSSINILFKDAFNQMQIELIELRPISTTLFGFAGYEVQPLRQISLLSI